MADLSSERQNSSRRRFMTRIAQLGAFATSIAVKPLSIFSQEKKSVEEKVDQFKERIEKSLSKPESVPLVEIDIDRDSAEKTFKELFAEIPERERYRAPSMKGKNGFPQLDLLLADLIAEIDFFKNEDQSRFLDEIDREIPWPNVKTFESVKAFIAKNEPAMQKIHAVIKESGYIAASDSQSVEFYDFRATKNYRVSEVLRKVAYHFEYRVLSFVRKEDWKSAINELLLFWRMITLRARVPLSKVDLLTLKGICRVYFDALIAVARHPRVTDEILKTAAHFASQNFRFAELEFLAFRHWTQVELVSYLAEIHECPNAGDQYLAIHRLALPTTKLPIAAKSANYQINFEGRKTLFEKELAQSKRIQEALARHAKPFDRSQTVQEIHRISERIAESIRHGTYYSSPRFSISEYYKAIESVDEVTMMNLSGAKIFINHLFQDITPKKKEKGTRDDEVPTESSEDSQKHWRQFAKMDNPLGKIFVFEFLLPYFNREMFPVMTTEVSQAAQLLIALKRYERFHGSRPDRLDDLVKDKLVTKISNNPFTDEPWAYSSERGVIWRTGEKGTKNGELDREPMQSDEAIAPPNASSPSRDEEQSVGIYRLLSR